MAASRHPWLETEPKYHVNSRPLDLTIRKIYCLDHSVKGKIHYARNFFWCMKDGKKLKKVEKGPETQDISVTTSVCVPKSSGLESGWNGSFFHRHPKLVLWMLNVISIDASGSVSRYKWSLRRCTGNKILRPADDKYHHSLPFQSIKSVKKENLSLLHFCVFRCEFISLVHFLALLCYPL